MLICLYVVRQPTFNFQFSIFNFQLSIRLVPHLFHIFAVEVDIHAHLHTVVQLWVGSALQLIWGCSTVASISCSLLCRRPCPSSQQGSRLSVGSNIFFSSDNDVKLFHIYLQSLPMRLFLQGKPIRAK